MSDIREAAQALLARLDVIHADERYKSVWTLAMIHGCEYTGPQYSEELEALRSALSAAQCEDDRRERNAAVGAAIQRAAKELPYGFEVELSVEQWAGTVVMRDPHGNLTTMDVDSDNRLAAEINAAIDAAMQTGE